MIKTLKVTNYLGDSLIVKMGGSDNSGLLIKQIDGLGPSKATINMSTNSTSDGGTFNSSYVNSRNIVLNFKYLENPTIELSRKNSYKYFPIKKQVKLEFTTDSNSVEIYGFVESNEPTIFSKSEETQISIICPDPYFYSLYNYLTIFYGVESNFEFEFSNESLTENLIEFGIIQNTNQNNVYYDGDAETGVYIEMKATGNASNITIYNLKTRTLMALNSDKIVELTGSDIINGDQIFISTVQNNKYVTLFRDGQYINILNALDKNSNWFVLSRGDNEFAYTADEGLTDLQFSISHKKLYEGI